MSTVRTTTFYCDNELLCSSEQDSGHGLPLGWFAVIHQLKPDGKQAHWHFCSIRCVNEAIKVSWITEKISDALESTDIDFDQVREVTELP